MAAIDYWLERKYSNLENQTASEAQKNAAQAGMYGQYAASGIPAEAALRQAQAMQLGVDTAGRLASEVTAPAFGAYSQNVRNLTGYTPSAITPDYPRAAVFSGQFKQAFPDTLPKTTPASSPKPSSVTNAYTNAINQNVGAPTVSGQLTQELLNRPKENRREGGLVGYAFGGEVSQNPLYDKYLTAMSRAGMTSQAVDPEMFMRSMAQLEAQRRLSMANQTNRGGTMAYAQGGAVDVGGMQVLGPGHGKSDSIPAVIDGQQPAALSTGEFIFPKKVVDYYGTKFLDAMVAKARQALREKQYA